MTAGELDLAAIRERAEEAASTSDLSVRITNTDPYTTLALVKRVEDAEAEVARLRKELFEAEQMCLDVNRSMQRQLATVAAVLDEHWDWKAGRSLHAAVSAVLDSDPAEVVAVIKADAWDEAHRDLSVGGCDWHPDECRAAHLNPYRSAS